MEITTCDEGMVRRVIERYFRALSTMDASVWAGTHAPNAITFVPTDDDPLATREDRRRYLQVLTAPFECLEIEPDRIWPALDGAAVKWTARGTRRDGLPVTFEGVDVFEIDDGRIRTVWSYWDPVVLRFGVSGLDSGSVKSHWTSMPGSRW